MKITLTSFANYVLLLTMLISCNNHQADTISYTLKMRLKPGDRFKQEMEMKMNTKMMAFSIDMKMKTGADFEVLTGDSSNKSLKVTYTQILVEMDKNMPGHEITDSISKLTNNRIKGKSVIVKLGPGNKIVEVTGFNELFSDSLAGPGSEAVRKMFDKETLNSTFGMMLSMYPEKPVKTGESWNSTTSMDLAGMKIGVDMKYTLSEVKDGMANIKFEGKLDNNGKMEKGGQQFSMIMNGMHTGTMKISMEDGYMRESDFKMDVTGAIEMMGQKMPMSMTAEGTMNGK